MATTKLGLPTISGNMTADVPRDLNALADAIDEKAGGANGLATLGPDGKVPASQLSVDTSNLATKTEVSTLNQTVTTHLADTTSHITAAERTKWNGAVTDIGAKTGLKTSAKTDLVSAINEAFQFANDGKTAVANAVTAKGVSASPSDTFSALANKIGQIITGKKTAEGSFPANGGSIYTVTGLDFLPRIVILAQATPGTNYGTYLVTVLNSDWSSTHYTYYSSGGSTGLAFGKTLDAPYYIVNGGFRLFGPLNIETKWFACE